MIQSIKLSITIAIIALMTGCASILSKSDYTVSITSTPSNAKVTVVNKKGTAIHTARTPTSITLPAANGFFSPASYEVTFEQEGYEKRVMTISAGVDGWYIGNILFGGLIGLLIIDPATGAMFKLTEALHAELTDTVSLNKETGIRFYSLSDIPEKWKENLVAL